MQPFINIHAHKPCADGDVLAIVNLHEHFDEAVKQQYCSLGIHPWYPSAAGATPENLLRHAMIPQVLAIGEFGFDRLASLPMASQQSLVAVQIAIASKMSKPIILHCVRAYSEMTAALRRSGADTPVIFHGFNKTMLVAQPLLADGYYLSFGQALFSERHPAAGVLAQTPASQFFLETDDSSFSIKEIYERAAFIRQTSLNALILQVQENFKRVFGTI